MKLLQGAPLPCVKGWGVLLIAVVLAAAPTAAAAKPSHPGERKHAILSFRASNGYRVEVQAPAGREALVSVVAESGPATVSYRLFGSLRADDSLNIHLPRIGRIAVEFDPVKTKRRRLPAGCTGHPTTVTSGYFRGTIELHGERNYMSVERRSAHGRVVRRFRKNCGNSALRGERVASGDNAAEMGQGTVLGVSSKEGDLKTGSLILIAGVVGFNPEGPASLINALRTRYRAGMLITNDVSIEDESNDLTAPNPDDPKIVELAPPPPFDGSATFELTSARTSTWTGDLAVEMPGMGRTRLAGPSFESTLCVESQCTKTASEVVVLLAELFSALVGLSAGQQRAAG